MIVGHGIAAAEHHRVATVDARQRRARRRPPGGRPIVAIDGSASTGGTQLKSRDRGARRRRDHASPSCATARRVDVDDHDRLQRGGQGFLGVGPTTEYAVGRPARRGARRRSTHEGRHVGHRRGARQPLLPVGRVAVQQELHVGRAEGGLDRRPERPRSLVGIVDQGSEIVGGDVWALLWLLGGISLILALFNLIPLLPFDGGHAAVVVYEWAASKITDRKVEVDYRKLMPVAAVVLAFFLTLSLSAMFLDVRQAIGQ